MLFRLGYVAALMFGELVDTDIIDKADKAKLVFGEHELKLEVLTVDGETYIETTTFFRLDKVKRDIAKIFGFKRDFNVLTINISVRDIEIVFDDVLIRAHYKRFIDIKDAIYEAFFVP